MVISRREFMRQAGLASLGLFLCQLPPPAIPCRRAASGLAARAENTGLIRLFAPIRGPGRTPAAATSGVQYAPAGRRCWGDIGPSTTTGGRFNRSCKGSPDSQNERFKRWRSMHRYTLATAAIVAALLGPLALAASGEQVFDAKDHCVAYRTHQGHVLWRRRRGDRPGAAR